MVTFARWEEGLVLAPDNPKGLRKIEDLARRNVKFVNREPGSGSAPARQSLSLNLWVDTLPVTQIARRGVLFRQ